MDGPIRPWRQGSAPLPPLRPVAGGDEPVLPSAASTQRLAEQLSARSHVFRVRSALDFTLIASLLRMGRPAAAERALDAHRVALREYAEDLGHLVADAAAEREAEAAFLDGDLADLRALPAVVEPERAPTPAPRRRRGAIGLLVAAALATAGVLAPALRPAIPITSDPDEVLAAAQLAAARERLANLQASPTDPDEVIAEARELHDRILALPPELLADTEVREQVDRLLVDEQRTLNELAAAHPESRSMLVEVRTLRASLDLPPHLEVVAPAAGHAAGAVGDVVAQATAAPSVVASVVPPVALTVAPDLPDVTRPVLP